MCRLNDLNMVPAKQFLFFCLVGVATTVVDLGVFNLLTRPAVGWRRIPANIVSVSTAMAWAFFANWIFVFHPDGYDWLGRAGRFLLTTAFSAFILQNMILYFTTSIWKQPVRFALQLVRTMRLESRLHTDMVSRNTCKLLAISGGLIWNFCWYKLFVFAN